MGAIQVGKSEVAVRVVPAKRTPNESMLTFAKLQGLGSEVGYEPLHGLIPHPYTIPARRITGLIDVPERPSSRHLSAANQVRK
jgi:hypothetical protein